jgi:hypothetical protein
MPRKQAQTYVSEIAIFTELFANFESMRHKPKSAGAAAGV